MQRSTTQVERTMDAGGMDRSQPDTAERAALSLDVELLEDRIAPAQVGFGLPIGPWRGEDCCE